MKHQTRLHQTGSLNWTCGAKPQAALPYHHVRSLLFSDIMKCWVVIHHWHFRRNCRFNLHGSRNPKETTQHDWCQLTKASFLGLIHHLIF